MITVYNKINLVFLTFFFCFINAQELFDPNHIHSIEINFYNPDYNEILEDRWEQDDKTYELAMVVFSGDTLDSVGVRYKGNSTYFRTHEAGSVKYPLNMDFDIIHEDQNLLGYNKLKLSNSIFDPTFVKETIGYITQGYYLPTSEVGYTTININGQYLGLYIMVESVNKPYLRKHFGNSEGTFFKCEPQFQFGDWYDAWPTLEWNGDDSLDYQYQMGYELKSDNGWSDILELIETLNFNPENIDNILNVDRALWFFASSIVMPDLDTYNGMFVHNYYLYKNTATGKFEIIPWDKDNTFGGFLVQFLIDWWFGNASWIYYWDPFASESDQTRPLFKKLMENPLYKKTFTAHLRTIIDDIYNVEYINDLAYGFQDIIEPYAESYPDVLPEFNSNDYFQYNVENYLVTPNGENYCGITSTVEFRREYLLGHNEIAKVAPEILFVFQNNMNPSPGDNVYISVAVTGAESVELMVNNEMYGDDFISVPMYDNGQGYDEIANDNLYVGMIPFDNFGDRVKYYVRASNDDALILDPRQAEWDFYYYNLGIEPLSDSTIVINEINYNSSDNHDSGDWVEIYNPTENQIDISSYVFKDDDDDHYFTFPENTFISSGDFMVICNDTSAFKTIHPNINNLFGNFDFGLSGGGELIRLYDSNLLLVDTVEYNDEAPWPLEPDGNGASLELLNPLLANEDAENWAASDGFGTPGEINSVYLSNNKFPNVPLEFKLYENYPNPFNPFTNIKYELESDMHVNISIFDLLGRKIKTLVNGQKQIGEHNIRWDAKDDYARPVAGGVYLYKIETETHKQAKKMIYLK